MFIYLYYKLNTSLPYSPKSDCYARGLGFDSQVGQGVLGFFYEILNSSIPRRVRQRCTYHCTPTVRRHVLGPM